MGKGKILFVNQEIMPFLSETESAKMGRYLPAYVQEHGRDIRVFMPRYQNVHERRNQLHEVIRLSGMNLIVNNCDHQLIIKVGSIPTARMQVYFIDNEEYFTKHGDFFDEKGRLLPDNDERIMFFGKGALEAVRKLAWQPDLIHFTGWFTCMIPFYLRRINKENAFFSGTKTVLTLLNDQFEGSFGEEMERKLKADGATAKDLKMFENLDYMTLMKAAITYAHGIVIGAPDVNPELLALAREKKVCLEYNPNPDEFYPQINKLYETVVGSGIKGDS